MKLFRFILPLLLLAGCGSPAEKVTTPAAISPQSTPTITPLSQKASQLQMGMTLKQVVTLLGKPPDAVSMIQGLTAYEWENSKNCHPVSVMFKRQSGGLRLNGKDEGRTCTGESSFNKPYGKSCKNNSLCKL